MFFVFIFHISYLSIGNSIFIRLFIKISVSVPFVNFSFFCNGSCYFLGHMLPIFISFVTSFLFLFLWSHVLFVISLVTFFLCFFSVTCCIMLQHSFSHYSWYVGGMHCDVLLVLLHESHLLLFLGCLFVIVLGLFICYSCSFVIIIYLLFLFFCYCSLFVIVLYLLLLFICYCYLFVIVIYFFCYFFVLIFLYEVIYHVFLLLFFYYYDAIISYLSTLFIYLFFIRYFCLIIYCCL